MSDGFTFPWKLGAALAAAFALAGCGGSGSISSVAGTPSPSASTTVITGLLVSPTGGSVAGDRVVLNLGSSRSLSTATDGQGHYALSVPRSAATGSDTLSVLDPTGTLLASVPVSLGAGGAVTVPAIAVGPPAPPGNV